MTFEETLKGFRPITVEENLDLSWYEGVPRFWQALSYLSTDSANLIGEFEGHQIVLRCKVIHGRVAAYLVFPPKDQKLIKHFAELGISCKVTEDYLKNFDCVPDVGNIEYFYEWDEKQFGKSWKNYRYGKNLFARLKERGLSIVTNPEQEKLIFLTKKWYEQRKSVSNTHKIVDRFFQLKKEKSFHCISDGENLLACSLVERLNDTSGAIVCRIKDYSHKESVGLINILHYMDLERWRESKLTIGSSVKVKSLSSHKNNLSPSKKIQIYSVSTKKSLTLEDYKKLKNILSGT